MKEAYATFDHRTSIGILQEVRQLLDAMDITGKGAATFKDMLKSADESHFAMKIHENPCMMAPFRPYKSRIKALKMRGHVVYSEFLAAAIDARTCLCEEVCWNAFKHFDRNDDGSISGRELQDLLHQQDIQEERLKKCKFSVESQL